MASFLLNSLRSLNHVFMNTLLTRLFLLLLLLTVAPCAGAILGGRVLDETGSLNAVVPAFTIATLFAAALPLALGRYPRQ